LEIIDGVGHSKIGLVTERSNRLNPDIARGNTFARRRQLPSPRLENRSARASPSRPAHVRSFDVRTGKQQWNFRTIPGTGELVTQIPLEGYALGTPMTSLHQGRQYLVVATISATSGKGELLALTLSE